MAQRSTPLTARPINSRYPCPCDKFACNDGSTCASLDGEDFFCSRACNGDTDVTTCDGVKGYGLQGLCNLTTAESPEIPVHCSVLCEYDGTKGHGCPSGLQCAKIAEGSIIKLCM